MIDDEQPDPLAEQIPDILRKVQEAAEEVGLYMIPPSIQVQATASQEEMIARGPVAVLDEGGHIIISATATIGDMAFSERVLNKQAFEDKKKLYSEPSLRDTFVDDMDDFLKQDGVDPLDFFDGE